MVPSIKKFFILVGVSLHLVGGLEFGGARDVSGDSIVNLPSNITCNELVGATSSDMKGSDCRCRSDKPIFHVHDNDTYGCSRYNVICPGCKGLGFGVVENFETLRINLLDTSLGDQLNTCNSNGNFSQARATLFVFKQLQYIELFTKDILNIQTSTNETILKINTTVVPFNLTGRLVKVEVWCDEVNTTEAVIAERKKRNNYIVKLLGQYEYPDNQVYYALTTPTLPTTSSQPSVTPKQSKRTSSKNLIFIVVIPVAAFLILVAIIIICISKRLNKREVIHQENNYKMDKARTSSDYEVGVFNPAYASDTIKKNDKVDGTLRNNNHSSKSNSQKQNGDIKIYTVVDLSQQPVSQRPIPKEESIQTNGQPQYASQTTLPRKRSSDAETSSSDMEGSTTITAMEDTDDPKKTYNKKYSQFSNTSTASEISEQSSIEEKAEEDSTVKLRDDEEEDEEEAKRKEFEGTLKRSKEMLEIFMNDFLDADIDNHDDDDDENDDKNNTLSKFPVQQQNSDMKTDL